VYSPTGSARIGWWWSTYCWGLLGAGANLGFMASGSELVLIAATVLNSAMWATLGAIAITVAQDLYPTGIGLASSLYFSALRFSAAIGGIAGGLGVSWFGVPGVFLVPALLCIVAALGLLIQAIRQDNLSWPIWRLRKRLWRRSGGLRS
jgi:MFS transporter, SET family, sugar efflux transporter